MLRGEREYRRVQPQEMTMDIINDSYLSIFGSYIYFCKTGTNICLSLTSQKWSQDKLSKTEEEVRNGRFVCSV